MLLGLFSGALSRTRQHLLIHAEGSTNARLILEPEKIAKLAGMPNIILYFFTKNCCVVNEDIIGATRMRIYYVANKLFFSNIAIAICTNAPQSFISRYMCEWIFIALDIHCFIFGINSLLLFFIALSRS